MEKRLFRRVNINDGICTLVKDGIYSGTIENVSLGGLFVTSDIQLKVRDRVIVNIKLPTDSGNINIHTNVIAIRIGNKAIALKFYNLDSIDFWTLQSFIRCANA
jgi:Tfp pilus assembly protein PilZ